MNFTFVSCIDNQFYHRASLFKLKTEINGVGNLGIGIMNSAKWDSVLRTRIGKSRQLGFGNLDSGIWESAIRDSAIWNVTASCQVWFHLAQWFQRRKLKCKKLTDDDDNDTDTMEDGRFMVAKALPDPSGQVS